MKSLKVPPGTIVRVEFSTVTLIFPFENDANDFAEWLLALDDPRNNNTEMIIKIPERKIDA